MDDGCTSPGAVEPPKRRVEPMLGKRSHRRITGVSGAVLFACMFLPAVKGCSEPVYPIEMPIFLHPYLYGLVFAIGAGTLSARGLKLTIHLLRGLSFIALAGGTLLVMMYPPLGIVEMLVACALLAAIGLSGYSERRVATTAIVVGAGSLLWFGFWVVSPDALVGAYRSAVGSLGLMIGGLVWLGELALRPPEAIVLPPAVARRRE